MVQQILERIMVTQWHLYAGSQHDLCHLVVRLNVKKRGVMNSCKLGGRRFAERDGYSIAQGYKNDEVEAVKNFSWCSKARANHLHAKLYSSWQYISGHNGWCALIARHSGSQQGKMTTGYMRLITLHGDQSGHRITELSNTFTEKDTIPFCLNGR